MKQPRIQQARPHQTCHFATFPKRANGIVFNNQRTRLPAWMSGRVLHISSTRYAMLWPASYVQCVCQHTMYALPIVPAHPPFLIPKVTQQALHIDLSCPPFPNPPSPLHLSLPLPYGPDTVLQYTTCTQVYNAQLAQEKMHRTVLKNTPTKHEVAAVLHCCSHNHS